MSSSRAKTKLAALVEKIMEQTEQGKLAWEITVDEGVFQTALADYSVKISMVGGRAFVIDSDNYKISIHNQRGVILEEVTDSQLDPQFEGKYFRTMKSIYESARRSALGADQAIDSILESLGKRK